MTTLVSESNRTVADGSHELVILRDKTDERITWDPSDDASLKAAAAAFDAERQQGSVAYAVRAGAESEVLQHFDPEAQHVVVASPLVGG